MCLTTSLKHQSIKLYNKNLNILKIFSTDQYSLNFTLYNLKVSGTQPKLLFIHFKNKSFLFVDIMEVVLQAIVLVHHHLRTTDLFYPLVS